MQKIKEEEKEKMKGGDREKDMERREGAGKRRGERWSGKVKGRWTW